MTHPEGEKPQRMTPPKSTPSHLPDPATNYERAKPEKEAGQGDLDSPVGSATPTPKANRQDKTVKNAHRPRQINAEDASGPNPSVDPPSPPRP